MGGRKIDGPLKSVWKAKKNLPLMLLGVRSHTFMIFAFGPSSQKKKFGIRSTFIKMQTPDRIVQPLFSYGWRSSYMLETLS